MANGDTAAEPDTQNIVNLQIIYFPHQQSLQGIDFRQD
jgi:hypothetical protein